MGILKRNYLNEEGVFEDKCENVCANCEEVTDNNMLCLIKGSNICIDCFWDEADRL